MKKFYYIKNGDPVGNCALWWRRGGCGYTCNLVEAGIYSEEQAKAICESRPELDTMWPVGEVRAVAQSHVDVQHLQGIRK